MKARLPDAISEKEDEKSVLCSGSVIIVEHEADPSRGYIEHEEIHFDWMKQEIKEEETSELPSSVLVSTCGSTSESSTQFFGCIQHVEEMIELFQDYSHTVIKCKASGPIRLVECPACSVQYKNSPDRLIRLFHHVSKCHKKQRMRLLKEILDFYYPLIFFMKKVLLITATNFHENDTKSKCSLS